MKIFDENIRGFVIFSLVLKIYKSKKRTIKVLIFIKIRLSRLPLEKVTALKVGLAVYKIYS